MKVLDTIERIPKIPPDQIAILPIARAMVFLHSRKTREALAELDKVIRLSDSGTLPPPVVRLLRRYALIVRCAVEGAMNDLEAVTKTATTLQQDAVADPEDNLAQSSVHFAMGMVALVKADRNGALEQWAHCSTEDTLCQGYLVMTSSQRTGQDPTGGSGTNAATAARARVNPHDPIFLYLSSRRSKL